MCLHCTSRSGTWQGRRAFLLAASAAVATPALAQVEVGKSSVARNLVPAENVEQAHDRRADHSLRRAME
jgi:hypothetical protein